LLFGVKIFSYVLGNYISIIESYKDFNKDPDEDEDLNRWFGLLQYYNDGQPLDSTLKKQIENHFHYRWTNDKNFIIQNAQDKVIFN
jgi:hypothetical protein